MEQTLKRAREFDSNRMMKDAQLLGRYLEGRSEEAFTELVSRHVDLVYFAALNRLRGNRHLANEVTQSVFADFARKAPALKTRAVLTGWLYTSTRFAAAQAMRTEQRRRTHEQEAQAMNELSATPEPRWNQLGPIIDEVLDALNERDREAVLLRFFENLSLAEIGAKLSLSPNAARMRVERALDKLRRLLAKRGIASTSVALAEIFSSQSGGAAPSGLVTRIVAAVCNPAAAVTAITFGIWKILAAVAIAAIATGLVVYRANRTHSPAVSSGPMSQTNSARQNPIYPTDPASSSSQAADNSSVGQPSPSSVEKKTNDPRKIAFLEKMKADPEFRASMIALARSRLGIFYQPLFTRLNLSAERLERFKDLLMEKELILDDMYEVLGSGQIILFDHDPSSLCFQLDSKLSQDVDDQIKVFLTPPAYAQFVDYSEDFGQWQTVNQVARILQSTDAPLTDEQANLLVVLLRAGRPKGTEILYTSMLYVTGAFIPAQKLGRITAPIFEEAREILSPAQMDALRQVQAAWGKKRY